MKCRIISGHNIAMLLVAGAFVAASQLPGTGQAVESTSTEINEKEQKKKKDIENKLKFLGMLVNKSPRAKKIEAGENAKAKKFLITARDYYERANKSMEQGKLDECDGFMDHALQAVGVAFRLAAEPMSRQADFQQKYRELHERIESFRKAFDMVVTEKGPETAELLDSGQMDELVLQGRTYAGKKKYEVASKYLAAAADMVERALSKAREKETLVYELKFDTPADEYKYEFERNRTYNMLANMVVAQCPPERANRLPLMRRLIQRNEELLVTAEAQAASGETKKAIKSLETGTQSLMRALRMGGMAL